MHDSIAGPLRANPYQILIRESGLWSMRLLVLGLAVRPLTALTGFGGLMRQRPGTEPVNSLASRRYRADRTTREEVVPRAVMLRFLPVRLPCFTGFMPSSNGSDRYFE